METYRNVQDSSLFLPAIGVFVALIAIRKVQSNQPSAEAKLLASKIPAYESPSLWATAKKFFSGSAPQFILECSRSINKVFRMPIPTPGLPCFVVVADYATARKVLEDVHATKWKEGYKPFEQVAGGPSNFFVEDGIRWKHVRKAVAPVFASEKDFYPRIQACLQSWVDTKLNPSIENDQAVNVSDELQKITIDIMTQEGFDYKWDPNGAEAQMFLRALQTTYLDFFRNATPTNLPRFLLGRLHPKCREAHRCTKDMRNIMRQMLDTHRQRKSRNEQYNPNSMICLVDENTNYQSDEERISDLLLLMAGGYDTSSFSISWILLELARHPEEQTKLRAALNACKTKEDGYACSTLKNVVRESMRVNATAALGSMRTISKNIEVPETKLSASYVIPKGSLCLTPYYAIHRDADVFDRPDEFLPSRWENPTKAQLAAYLPYAVGRRNCLGRSLANAELTVIVADLISAYEWTVEDEGVVDYYVTLKNSECLLRAKPVG